MRSATQKAQRQKRIAAIIVLIAIGAAIAVALSPRTSTSAPGAPHGAGAISSLFR